MTHSIPAMLHHREHGRQEAFHRQLRDAIRASLQASAVLTEEAACLLDYYPVCSLLDLLPLVQRPTTSENLVVFLEKGYSSATLVVLDMVREAFDKPKAVDYLRKILKRSGRDSDELVRALKLLPEEAITSYALDHMTISQAPFETGLLLEAQYWQAGEPRLSSQHEPIFYAPRPLLAFINAQGQLAPEAQAVDLMADILLVLQHNLSPSLDAKSLLTDVYRCLTLEASSVFCDAVQQAVNQCEPRVPALDIRAEWAKLSGLAAPNAKCDRFLATNGLRNFMMATSFSLSTRAVACPLN